MSEILAGEYELFVRIQHWVGKLEERTTLLEADIKHEDIETLNRRLSTSKSMFSMIADQLKKDIKHQEYMVAIQVRLNDLSFRFIEIGELIEERITRYSAMQKFFQRVAKWITAKNRLIELLQILADAIPIPFVREGIAIFLVYVREITTQPDPKQLPPPKHWTH